MGQEVGLTTGRAIFDCIRAKENELRELKHGMDQLKNKGTHHTAYRVLEEECRRVEKEFRDLLNREYTY